MSSVTPPPGLGFKEGGSYKGSFTGSFTGSFAGSEYTALTYDTQSEYSSSQDSGGLQRQKYRGFFARGKKTDASRPRLGTDQSDSRSRFDSSFSESPVGAGLRGLPRLDTGLYSEPGSNVQRKIYPPRGPVPKVPSSPQEDEVAHSRTRKAAGSPKRSSGVNKRWTMQKAKWLLKAMTLERKTKKNHKKNSPKQPKKKKKKRRFRMLRSQASLFKVMVRHMHIPADAVERYLVTFGKEAVDLKVLRGLDDNDLKELGIVLGHRRKILQYFRGLEEVECEL